MHSFSDALSTKCRRDDWDQVQKVCRKKGFQLPQELVDGTLHQEIGAAEALLELLYEHLTQKQIRRAEEVRSEAVVDVSQPGCKRKPIDWADRQTHQVYWVCEAGAFRMCMGWAEVAHWHPMMWTCQVST